MKTIEASAVFRTSASQRLCGKMWRWRGWRWAERLLAVIGLYFVVQHFTFDLAVITSGSMAPTLQGDSYATGDRIVLEKVTAHFRAPRRWEIYYFYEPDGTPVAKRIIALPGEKISMKKNQIFINGEPLQNPPWLRHVKYHDFGNLTGGRVVDCGPDYFVLGDDSRDSFDSRFIGPVSAAGFEGRVCGIVWPPGRVGWVR